MNRYRNVTKAVVSITITWTCSGRVMWIRCNTIYLSQKMIWWNVSVGKMQAIWERSNLTDEGDDNFIQSKMLTRQVDHKTCWREQLRYCKRPRVRMRLCVNNEIIYHNVYKLQWDQSLEKADSVDPAVQFTKKLEKLIHWQDQKSGI